jgi:hypothetical protein
VILAEKNRPLWFAATRQPSWCIVDWHFFKKWSHRELNPDLLNAISAFEFSAAGCWDQEGQVLGAVGEEEGSIEPDWDGVAGSQVDIVASEGLGGAEPGEEVFDRSWFWSCWRFAAGGSGDAWGGAAVVDVVLEAIEDGLLHDRGWRAGDGI